MSDDFKKKELKILREAVDKAEKKAGKILVDNAEVRKIIKIAEDFLRTKKLVCYGGTAINNILPEDDQFYNKSTELPDYDFFSPNALSNAKELANIYYKNGYGEVEAKSGMHYGTYKVFVNSLPVADITYLHKDLFNIVQINSIKVDGILYAPPDYLRMSMYLELSRPDGDVSRWEKILKRLILLNKHYPMQNPRCDNINFMRTFEGEKEEAEDIYRIVKNSIIDQELVFFGGYASKLYSRYMPKDLKHKFLDKSPDFDVLSNEPKESAAIIKKKLESHGYENINIINQKGVGEMIAPHYEISINDDTIAFIYKPLACHSFNTIKIKGKTVKVATIDTMLSFYLAFLYADREYYDKDRIYCMAQYLFMVQAKNRLAQKGVLKRFSLDCIGKQDTLADIRNRKLEKYKELKKNPFSTKYEKWFLRYIPRTMNNRHANKSKKITNKKSIKTKRSASKHLHKPKKKKIKKTKKLSNKNVPVEDDKIEPVEDNNSSDKLKGLNLYGLNF